MGLRSPPPRLLFFYEKRSQKRIKEEVSSLISPRAENLSESFEVWNNRSILGDNDTKLYFSTIYNIVLENLAKLDSPLGGSKGAEPPSAGNPKTRRFLVYLCLLSLHKKVGAVWSA